MKLVNYPIYDFINEMYRFLEEKNQNMELILLWLETHTNLI